MRNKTNIPQLVFDGNKNHVINMSKIAVKCNTNHIALLRVKELMTLENLKFTFNEK